MFRSLCEICADFERLFVCPLTQSSLEMETEVWTARVPQAAPD